LTVERRKAAHDHMAGSMPFGLIEFSETSLSTTRSLIGRFFGARRSTATTRVPIWACSDLVTTVRMPFQFVAGREHSRSMTARSITAGIVLISCLVGARVPASAGGGCPDLGDTGGANDGFPGRMSTLVGADIRTGGHECFERVVLELQGSGDLPGYQVQYVSDPVLESPSGNPTDIAGDATLVLSFGAWMMNPDGSGYTGPTEFVPTNVTNIRELELIENFEGQSAWAIGLDQQRGFVVSTLSDPVRIVIDIELDAGGAPAPAPTTAPPTAPGAPPASLPATR
jgi:hypothetical protein